HPSSSALLYPPSPRPPLSTLFPYTTLFRSNPPPSSHQQPDEAQRREQDHGAENRHAAVAADHAGIEEGIGIPIDQRAANQRNSQDRKSTRLNSSHVKISYAVFCLKKKNRQR